MSTATAERTAVEIPLSLATVAVNAAQLTSAIRVCEPSTDPECTRYAVGGIRFESAAENTLDCVATDSRRMAVATLAATGESWNGAGFSLNLTFCRIVSALLQSAPDESVQITPEDRDGNEYRSVRFEASTWSITLPTMTERFPRWRDVFPCHESSATVDVGAARQAVNAIAKGKSRKEREKRLGVSVVGGELVILDIASDVSAKAPISGSLATCILRAEYIRDAFDGIGEGIATLQSTDGSSPLTISAERDGVTIRHLIAMLAKV